MTLSPYDFLSQGTDLKVRKLLARSYLRDSRLDEAIEVYLGILSDVPEDADVHRVFENLCRLAGFEAVPGMINRESVEALKAQICRTAADFREAADLGRNGRNGSPENGQGESLQQLMPALIELNIRHAREAGRADLAEALRSLQINLTRQVFGPKDNGNGR